MRFFDKTEIKFFHFCQTMILFFLPLIKRQFHQRKIFLKLINSHSNLLLDILADFMSCKLILQKEDFVNNVSRTMYVS